MQQIVCLPYQLMRSVAGVIVVLAQLQNHCRSRETCSFGTPDAVVCKAARSASAALAAVGESVGIAERAGAASLLFGGGRSGQRVVAAARSYVCHAQFAHGFSLQTELLSLQTRA